MTLASTSTHRDVADTGRLAPAGWLGSRFPTQVRVLTSRAIRAELSDRRVVVIRMLQPIVFLLVLSQVFGSMVDRSILPAGVSYLDYLLPAILVTSGVSSAAGAGAVFSRDMENGMMTRLRSLPISMSSLLVARGLADLARTAAQLVVLVGASVAFSGFAPAGGALGVACAVGLAALVTWSLIWVFLALAAWLRSMEAVQGISAMVTFPLMFASSAFAPLDGLPAWLRAVAVVNPLTYAVDASRALALGLPAGREVAAALATSLAVTVLAACAAVRGFRRPPVR